MEGAGAAGLAALLEARGRNEQSRSGPALPDLTGQTVILLLTGRNIDPHVHHQAVQSAKAMIR